MHAKRAGLTLGEVSRLTGVPEWKIRYWLQRGRIPEPQRVGNLRMFTTEHVARIRELLGDPKREAVTS